MSEFPAIALIEFRSVAAGALAADAMMKKAVVQLLDAGTVQPGRYLVLIGGLTAEVDESWREGLRAAAGAVLDDVFLPDAHPSLVAACTGQRQVNVQDAVAILETTTSAAILRCTDAAIKGAMVELQELRVADGLGGKGVSLLAGELADVQAAVEIATLTLAGRDVVLCKSIVSNIEAEFASRLAVSSRFHRESGT
jgi:microcompartment protein CcmL/EutN